MGLPNRGFRMEDIANIHFHGNHFLMIFGMGFYRFLEALGAVFLISLALKTGLETQRFLMKSRILSSGTGGADLGPLKT